MSNDWKVGNFKENTLAEILTNPKYEEIMGLKPDLPEKCQTCEYLKLCYGGCPRNRVWLADKMEDVFCTSYKMIYRHSAEKLEFLATKIRKNWLNQHIKSGRPLPGRNDRCLCGSGKKFKQCCGQLV